MELRKVAETANTITLGWTPPPDVQVNILYDDRGRRSTAGVQAKTAKFDKGHEPYEVAAVCRDGAGVFRIELGTYPAGPVTPAYTHRFATFDPSTDDVAACLNRFSDAAHYWWVPGTPEGSPWPSGGGIFPISTPHGPGFKLKVTEEMTYQNVSWASDIARFVAFHNTANFRGQEQVWEWAWRWPSAENPAGWADEWTTGEGLTFCVQNSVGPSVGHHLYLHKDAGQPLKVRFGRQDFVRADGNSWAWTYGPAFPADTYVHNRLAIKWAADASGYIRAFSGTDPENLGEPWMSYDGPTLPLGWDVWTVYMNVRTPNAFPHTNTLEWINHRLTVA